MLLELGVGLALIISLLSLWLTYRRGLVDQQAASLSRVEANRERIHAQHAPYVALASELKTHERALNRISASAQRALTRIGELLDDSVCAEGSYATRHVYGSACSFAMETLQGHWRLAEPLVSSDLIALRGRLDVLAQPGWRKEPSKSDAVRPSSHRIAASMTPEFMCAIRTLLVRKKTKPLSSVVDRVDEVLGNVVHATVTVVEEFGLLQRKIESALAQNAFEPTKMAMHNHELYRHLTAWLVVLKLLKAPLIPRFGPLLPDENRSDSNVILDLVQTGIALAVIRRVSMVTMLDELDEVPFDGNWSQIPWFDECCVIQ